MSVSLIYPGSPGCNLPIGNYSFQFSVATIADVPPMQGEGRKAPPAGGREPRLLSEGRQDGPENKEWTDNRNKKER